MKKYICIGGEIISKTDSQFHYISPYRLAKLYNVNPQECYFADNENSIILRGLDMDKLIELRPRYDGDYKIPTQPREEERWKER